GTGELLAMSVLLLLSVSADIRIEDSPRAGVWMAVHEVLFVMSAIGAVTLYGALRTKALELLTAQGSEGLHALRLFAVLSWAYVGYAVLHAVPVKVVLLRDSYMRTQNGS